MPGAKPLIWVLLGEHKGDNNQVLALAEELGFPFEIKQLSFRRIAGYDLGRMRPTHLGSTLFTLDKAAAAQIRPPWPDLVIGVGRRSVPVARYIRRMNLNRTKLVRIGNPRIDPRLFDLVITTPQYEVPTKGNVLTLPVAMSRFREPAKVEPAARAWLDEHPRPHLLLALGGNTKDVELIPDQVRDAAITLGSRAAGRSGSLLIVGSPRTPPALLRAVADSGTIVPKDGPSFAAMLDDADEIFVTADSISMLSEAIVTGKPVGMIPAVMTERGLQGVGEAPKGLLDFRSPRRDPRHFWERLLNDGLAGTVDEPRASSTANSARQAAQAVRQLLGDAD